MDTERKEQITERWIFIETPAYVGRVDNEFTCGFWADNPISAAPSFDKKRLTPIDLSLTPNRSATPQSVIVDDFETEGGFTTLGPGFPSGAYWGTVQLEMSYRASLPVEQQPPLPPHHTSGRDYEFMSVYYWPSSFDPRAGRRYLGIHAVIVDYLPARGKTLAVEVDLYPRGSSLTEPPFLRTWINLGSVEQCDPESLGGLTRITPGTNPAGALYISPALINIVPRDVKIPHWAGC